MTPQIQKKRPTTAATNIPSTVPAPPKGPLLELKAPRAITPAATPPTILIALPKPTSAAPTLYASRYLFTTGEPEVESAALLAGCLVDSPCRIGSRLSVTSTSSLISLARIQSEQERGKTGIREDSEGPVNGVSHVDVETPDAVDGGDELSDAADRIKGNTNRRGQGGCPEIHADPFRAERSTNPGGLTWSGSPIATPFCAKPYAPCPLRSISNRPGGGWVATTAPLTVLLTAGLK